MVRAFLVFFISTIAIAASFEIYLRKAGFLDAQPASYPCVAGDHLLNHVFQRNCSGDVKASALKTSKDVAIKTNALGYRGHLPIEGKKTIVVLGDSYTEGFGLNEDETFPAQLEAALHRAGRKDWEVLNGGTLGFSPVLYAKYFDRYFLEERPEIVLLNLDFSDVNEDGYYLHIAEYDAYGNPAAFPGRDIFPSWVLSHVYSSPSALVRFIHQEANQWASIRRRESATPLMDQFVSGERKIPLDELRSAGLEGCAKLLEAVGRNVLKVKARAEAIGALFVLHMYPPGNVVKQYPAFRQNISFVQAWDNKNRSDNSWFCGVGPKAVDIFRAFSAREKIPFADSFPLVMGNPMKETLYFDEDAHWNEAGVHLVANDVAKKLLPLMRRDAANR